MVKDYKKYNIKIRNVNNRYTKEYVIVRLDKLLIKEYKILKGSGSTTNQLKQKNDKLKIMSLNDFLIIQLSIDFLPRNKKLKIKQKFIQSDNKKKVQNLY